MFYLEKPRNFKNLIKGFSNHCESNISIFSGTLNIRCKLSVDIVKNGGTKTADNFCLGSQTVLHAYFLFFHLDV